MWKSSKFGLTNISNWNKEEKFEISSEVVKIKGTYQLNKHKIH